MTKLRLHRARKLHLRDRHRKTKVAVTVGCLLTATLALTAEVSGVHLAIVGCIVNLVWIWG